MINQMHENAIKNYNSCAQELIATVERVEQVARENQPRINIRDERYVTLTITSEMLLENPKFTTVDQNDETVERQFEYDGALFRIRGENFLRLRKLANDIQRQKPLSEKVSRPYLENRLFEWIESRYTQHSSESFFDHLERFLRVDVQRRTLYIPVASTTVESAFQFCGVNVQTLTSGLLEHWVAEFRLGATNIFVDPSENAGLERIKKIIKDMLSLKFFVSAKSNTLNNLGSKRLARCSTI